MEFVDKFIEQLASQSPAAVAIIIVVVYFLRALKDIYTTFSKNLMERDRLFTTAMEKHDQAFTASIEHISDRVLGGLNGLQDSILLLDQHAREKMGLKRPRRKTKSPAK